jgi:uncharacterized protein Yka (UPF0111/DUF47 family)
VRVNPSALAARLEKGLVGAYVLFGAEPLMLEEAADQIRVVARQAGVDEVRSLTAGIDLEWSELDGNARSLSLFSSRRLIEIRLPTGKPGDAGSKAMLTYLDEKVEDTILVVIAGRIDKRGQSSKWFKAMEKEGLVVEARALTRDQLPRWIEQRLNTQKIAATPGAVQRLAYYAEGNLMAAAQEIRKLAEESKQAADNIKNIIDQITGEIRDAVDSTQKGVTVVSESADTLRETITYLTNIADLLQDASSRMSEVKEQIVKTQDEVENALRSLENLAASAEETTASAEEVSSAVEEQTAATEELERAARDLKDIVSQLRTIISKFRL